MKTLLRELWLVLSIAYLEAAQRSLCASHPDQVYITLRLHWLREQRRSAMRWQS